MRVIVFGAAGGIGRQVVDRALRSGHRVTAVVRNARKLALEHEQLIVAQGDVLDRDAIARVLDGAEAVVSTIGVNSRKPTRLYSEGTRNVLAAMASQGVQRFICVSAAGFHIDKNDPPFLRYVLKPAISWVLKDHFADLARMERVVAESSVDWTVIAPPALTNGPRTGAYRVAIGENVRNGRSISRADVADYIVAHLAPSQSLRSLVYLAS